jgi:hypothetical protein
MTTRALVPGSVSIAGIAWMAGLLAGLAESGVDVLAAGLALGTSADTRVAAVVAARLPAHDWLGERGRGEQVVAKAGPRMGTPVLAHELPLNPRAVLGPRDPIRRCQRRPFSKFLAACGNLALRVRLLIMSCTTGSQT